MGGCLGPLSQIDSRDAELGLLEILVQIFRSGSLMDLGNMNDFKIHHHIIELISLLRRVDHSVAVGAEVYEDLLLKGITSSSSAQVGAALAIKKLSENCSMPDELRKKYVELKSKNCRDVDALVCVLFKIAEDEKTKTFLARNAQKRLEVPFDAHREPSSPQASGKMSVEEVTNLRSRLLKVTRPGASSSGHSSRKFECGLSEMREVKNYLEMPACIMESPHLTLDFVVDASDSRNPGALLGALPLPSQEHTLIEDILDCLAGNSGEHIIALPLETPHSVRSFAVDSSIDRCFKRLIERILPVCSNFSLVSRFIKEKMHFQFGQVNHSLCAAMRSVIKDHLTLVAQLEHQHRQGLLTFQKLWVYIQPTLQTMGILADFSNAINQANATGGVVLSMLHEKTCNLMGNPKAQKLCLYLTQAACVPYFEILEKWIYKGIICDSFKEFLVEDNELVNKEELPITEYSDDYWEKRCTICKERIPSFLEKVADMILRTGKYLNVIRQCGQDVKCPDAEEIVYTLNERQYVEKIEKSYSFASKQLLHLLLEENDLMGRLKSVKHYFLLDQGDFIVQFMDMADDELRKNINDIMPTRLESLLELALRTSVANNDPYNDDVRVMLHPFDLMSQMFRILSINGNYEYKVPSEAQLSGLEAFSFHYEVKWPLSLILNQKVRTLYQMLFRQLFYLKHVERLLCSVWICNKVAKSFVLSASRWYAPAFALRQRMLNFVRDLEYYMTFEVLEPSWHLFMNQLQTVANVDDVLRIHFDFLNNCLKDCMLTSPELLKIVINLMKTFVDFSYFILHMNKYSVDAEMSCMLQPVDHSNAESPDAIDDLTSAHSLAPGESFEQRIAKYDNEFSENLVILLDRISDLGRENYNEKLVNILYRVNFNRFYTERLEKFASEQAMKAVNVQRPKKKKPPVPPKSPKVARMGHTSSESSG